jgi:hypothetical protein
LGVGGVSWGFRVFRGVIIATSYSSFWYCILTPFYMHSYPFWSVSDRVGGVFRFLSCNGGFFTLRCMTPPSSLCNCVGFRCLGARFCAESDRGGPVLRFLLWISVCFIGRCMPPLPVQGSGFSSSFSWEESWIRLTRLFFRIFLYFFLFYYLGYARAIILYFTK